MNLVPINIIKIYLAHALTNAPETFRMRMYNLRLRINQIPNAKVLEFNWVHGVGPDPKKNTYQDDMKQVHQAHLMVGVLDYPSTGFGMELQERCRIHGSVRLFVPKGSKPNQIVLGCLKTHRSQPANPFVNGVSGSVDELLDPIEYRDDDDIFRVVYDWVKMRQEQESEEPMLEFSV